MCSELERCALGFYTFWTPEWSALDFCQNTCQNKIADLIATNFRMHTRTKVATHFTTCTRFDARTRRSEVHVRRHVRTHGTLDHRNQKGCQNTFPAFMLDDVYQCATALCHCACQAAFVPLLPSRSFAWGSLEASTPNYTFLQL